MTEVLAGGADRAAAAVRALDRAERGTTAAVALLRSAGDVDWTGPGAATYRDALAVLLDGVLRVRVRLRDAEQAAAEHAAALRAEEERSLAAARAAGFAAPRAVLLPGSLPSDRWAVP